jgi:hypothetical protein
MNRANLILHCGNSKVERNYLPMVDMPEKTRSYCPVAHHELVDLVESKMNDCGFHFATQAHSLNKEGTRYFGLMQLVNGTDLASEQHGLVVGLRNSYDKSFPAAMAFGSHVFVCDNLAFTGEVTISRRHTTNIWQDLPGLVISAVSQTKVMAHNQTRRFKVYQQATLSDLDAEHIIVEMLRQEVVTTSRIVRVVNEWDEPSYDHGEKSAWRLFNAATEALKGSPLPQLPQRTIVLQALLDDVTGFKPTIEGETIRSAA